MKKLLVFILTSSLIFNAFGDKKASQFEVTEKKELYLLKDVITTIAQYLKSPKKLLELAVFNNDFYVGVKQFVNSKKIFDTNPSNWTAILCARASLSTHDREITCLPETFEDVLKELKIKFLYTYTKKLFEFAYENVIKILDYLIALHNARTYLKQDCDIYNKLINLEELIIKEMAQLLPDKRILHPNHRAFCKIQNKSFKKLLETIIDVKTEENQFFSENTLKEVSDLYKKNPTGMLRLFYLNLIIEHYDNLDIPKNNDFWHAIIQHWKKIAYYPPNIGTDSTYILTLLIQCCGLNAFDIMLKIFDRADFLVFDLLDEEQTPQVKNMIIFILDKISLDEVEECVASYIDSAKMTIESDNFIFFENRTGEDIEKNIHLKIKTLLNYANEKKRKMLIEILEDIYTRAKQKNDTITQRLIKPHLQTSQQKV